MRKAVVTVAIATLVLFAFSVQAQVASTKIAVDPTTAMPVDLHALYWR